MSDTERDAPLFRPGDILAGKFRVERVLGEGGMGVVLACTHLSLHQLVAVKLMLPTALMHPDNVERFEREARASVRLRSEHVARVSDVGRMESGAPYIVMEYLQGEDLDQLLDARRPIPIEAAVDYVLQACEAVAEAHSLGIVHRDLKPKNLFLTRSVSNKPLVKVLDFGISKMASESELSLTATTQVMGSPNYMSPEQLRSSRNVDARTDIWALGAILYELLAGQVPFVATSVTELTAMVIADPPVPLLDLRREVPPALVAAIFRCLEKPRENRFQTVAEFAAAIAPFASAEGVSKAQDVMSTSGRFSEPRMSGAPEPNSVRLVGPGASTASAWDRTQLAPPSSRRTPVLIGAAIALVSVLGAVGFVALNRAPSSQPASASAAPLVTSAPDSSAVHAAAVAPPVVMTVTPPVASASAASSAKPVVIAPVVAPVVAHARPDAGAVSSPPVVVAPPVVTHPEVKPVSSQHELPNVRN